VNRGQCKVTPVVLGGGVGLDVCAEVGAVGEGLAAVRTAEWFLAAVRALVTTQQPRPRERLVAHRTAVPARDNSESTVDSRLRPRVVLPPGGSVW